MSQLPARNAVECYFRALQIRKHEVAHLVQAQPYKALGSLIFFIDLILPSDSACSKSE